MAFAIIPLSMKAYVTATATSGDYTLYALKFVTNNDDEDDIEGVQAIYTAEDLQIPLISTQQTYGTYYNPIDDGTNYIFKAAYLGDKFTATVAKNDTETLSGEKAMVFTNDNAEERLLPVVTAEDVGKTVVVNEDGEWELGEAEKAAVILNVNLMGTTQSKINSAIAALTNYNNYNEQQGVSISNADAKALIDTLDENNFSSSLLKAGTSSSPIYFVPESYDVDTDDEMKLFVYKTVVNLFENNLGTSVPLKIIYVAIRRIKVGSSYNYYAHVKGVSYDLRSADAPYETPSAVYTQILSKMTGVLVDATTNKYAHDQVVVGSEADNAAFANDIKEVAYMISNGKTAVTILGTTFGKPLFANYSESGATHLYEFGTESFFTQSNYYYRISMWYHSSSDFGIVIDMFAELIGEPSTN